MARTSIVNVNSWQRTASSIAQALILMLSLAIPLLMSGSGSAAQLTNRKVTINKSAVGSTAQGQNVQYDFEFDFESTDVEGIVFEFCDSPLGTCVLPTGMNVNRSLTTLDGHTGFPTNGTAFAEFATDNTGDCDDIDGSSDDTMYCVTRTEATAAAGTNATIDLGAITNPTSIDTVYIRIGLYDDAAFAPGDRVHEGTVAAAIVDQLTINGRVQERLDFCVAAVDDADTMPATVAACSALTDQNVDLGIIDESTVAVTPVDTTANNGSDDDYGILMANTNASNGLVLSYYAEAATNVSGADTDQLRGFRVVPTNCDASASSTTDQCFVSAANAGTGSVITAGDELFGMYIACVDTSSSNAGAQALTSADADYDGSDNTVSNAAACENETFTSGTAVVGWNTGSSADTLISSTTSVNDEAVKLRFAATAESTTPSGNYTVVTTYIATATF